jgi:RNA polymerase sigma-70 factor (ECF subfamily)
MARPPEVARSSLSFAPGMPVHAANGKPGSAEVNGKPVRHQAAVAPVASGSRAPSAAFTPEELTEIVDRYQLAVYSFFRARVLQESDAEDLTQEVFLRFYTSKNRFDDSREIRPYLLGIARNLLRERARTLRHRNEVSWTELCLEVEESVGEAEENQDERLDRLPQCISRLGPAARLAIELYYGARLRVQEIARRMQRSEGATKVLLHRARLAIKHCLASQDQAPQESTQRDQAAKPDQTKRRRNGK